MIKLLNMFRKNFMKAKKKKSLVLRTFEGNFVCHVVNAKTIELKTNESGDLTNSHIVTLDEKGKVIDTYDSEFFVLDDLNEIEIEE